MDCEMGFLCEARRCDSLRMIRGELAIEAYFHAANLYSVGGLGPDHDAVMRIGVGLQPTGLTRGKLRAAGPIFESASSTSSNHGCPPPRIVNSAVRQKASASAAWC